MTVHNNNTVSLSGRGLEAITSCNFVRWGKLNRILYKNKAQTEQTISRTPFGKRGGLRKKWFGDH